MKRRAEGNGSQCLNGLSFYLDWPQLKDDKKERIIKVLLDHGACVLLEFRILEITHLIVYPECTYFQTTSPNYESLSNHQDEVNKRVELCNQMKKNIWHVNKLIEFLNTLKKSVKQKSVTTNQTQVGTITNNIGNTIYLQDTNSLFPPLIKIFDVRPPPMIKLADATKFTTLSPFFSYEEAVVVITKKEKEKSNKRFRHKKDYWCECCSIKFTDLHEVCCSLHLLTSIALVNNETRRLCVK